MDEASETRNCPVNGCDGQIVSPGVCSICGEIKFFKVSQERTSRISYEREVWAPTKEKAIQIVKLGTAWPSSYDDKELEVLSEEEPVAVDVTADQRWKYHMPDAGFESPEDIKKFKEELSKFVAKGEANDL